VLLDFKLPIHPPLVGIVDPTWGLFLGFYLAPIHSPLSGLLIDPSNAGGQNGTTVSFQMTEPTSGDVATVAAAHNVTRHASPSPSQTKESR
jgi:hypothetical protein